jgi:eukaryotic-like serine/threonine-protein kinase
MTEKKNHQDEPSQISKNSNDKSLNPAPSELLTVGTEETEASGSFIELKVEDRVGHYEIVGELGSGGMGVVYKAYDPALKRYAALKLIRTENPNLAARFGQEARTQARVQHENVCRVYEVGEVQGKQYIAMQLIEGKSLSAAAKGLSLEAKVRVIKQIADALHVAHKEGLIHRDVKPSNIMLERSEEMEWKPYVLDFGLAKDQDAPGLTRTGMAVGTPYYMAPEQVASNSDHLDGRTDVYGLGATLYELLCGKPPYQGSSGGEVLLQILKDDPIHIGKVARKTPQDLQTIVMKCLERDTSQRYDSAKSLSEDLQRYLDGDPVTAKPTSFSYRLIKRAKKNRLATGIALLAATITLILVGTFLWAQWQNKLQAEYAREFGDEIKNIQSALPNIYTAPLHDVRPEIAELRNRLKRMEERVKQGGRAAEDPGANAVGQGYLALGEFEKAREHLEKAWKAGHQTPSTAYALGQAMGLLFQKKLGEAERITSQDVRKILKQQYEKEFRDPAVSYLKKAEGSVESPAYVEGLIALYDKRYDDALKKSKEAYQQSRWSYEAKTLEGKALAGMAQKKSEAADFKGALQQYGLAGEAYAKAAELGRSRADIYLSDCDRWDKTMVAQSYTDVSPVVSLQKAEETCNKAILVDPDNPSSYIRKAYLYSRLARSTLYSSAEDPRLLTKKAIGTAKEAVRKDPKSWEAHSLMVGAYQVASEYEVRHGIDPTKSIAEAINHANQGLRIRENSPGILNILGVTYSLLGEYEAQSGKNPTDSYKKAIQQYQRIEQLDKSFETEMETGIAYWFIATYQMEHGEDPKNSFHNAIEQLEKSLKESPDDPYFLYNLGIVYSSLAQYEESSGKSPLYNLRRALEVKQKAVKFIPNHSYVLGGIGGDYTVIATYLVKQKKDPSTELNEARKFLAQALQVDEKYYLAYAYLGDTEMATAKLAMRQGQSPVAYFDAARKAYKKSIECNIEEPRTYALMADVYHWEADWQIQQKRSAKTSIENGMHWIDKGLKLSADDYFAIAIQGTLFLQQARAESNSTKRTEYAATAITALEKAIQKNPLLRTQYEPFLKEARELK